MFSASTTASSSGSAPATSRHSAPKSSESSAAISATPTRSCSASRNQDERAAPASGARRLASIAPPGKRDQRQPRGQVDASANQAVLAEQQTRQRSVDRARREPEVGLQLAVDAVAAQHLGEPLGDDDWQQHHVGV